MNDDRYHSGQQQQMHQRTRDMERHKRHNPDDEKK